MSDDTPDPGVSKETITLPDGRYLIYYTFPDTDESVRTAAELGEAERRRGTDV